MGCRLTDFHQPTDVLIPGFEFRSERVKHKQTVSINFAMTWAALEAR